MRSGFLRNCFIYISVFLLTGIAGTRAPAEEEYVAFSLNMARTMIESDGGFESDEWRVNHPEVLYLDGITRIYGLVHDTRNDDAVIVGQRDPSGCELTLDDFVVALRARMIRGEWPLVSIDPLFDENGEMGEEQHVRFEGGIENTAFGNSLYEADFLLKLIGMNEADAGIPGLRTDEDLARRMIGAGQIGSYNVHCRYWFYPASLNVVVGEENVVSVNGMQAGSMKMNLRRAS